MWGEGGEEVKEVKEVEEKTGWSEGGG